MIIKNSIFLMGALALSAGSVRAEDVAEPEQERAPDLMQPAAGPAEAAPEPRMAEPEAAAPVAAESVEPVAGVIEIVPVEQQPVAISEPSTVISTVEIESMEPEPVSLEPVLEDDFEGEDEAAVEELSSVSQDVQGGTRGNWYKKQQAVKRAHEEYQTVRKLEAQVVPYEQQFLSKKNEFQSKVEEFSQAVGFAMGQLDQLIADYITYFDRQTKPEGVMSEADRLALTDLNEKKRELEQLKKDFEAVKQSRGAIDQAMTVVLQQLSLCHDYEQQAFEKYEKIAHVLSDQVAEQLYIEIKTYGENIQAIDLYLRGEFAVYLDALLKKASEQVDIVQMSLRTLKERGINLAVSPAAGIAVSAGKTEQAPKAAKSSWVGAIWSSIWGLFKSLGYWIRGWFH